MKYNFNYDELTASLMRCLYYSCRKKTKRAIDNNNANGDEFLMCAIEEDYEDEYNNLEHRLIAKINNLMVATDAYNNTKDKLIKELAEDIIKQEIRGIDDTLRITDYILFDVEQGIIRDFTPKEIEELKRKLEEERIQREKEDDEIPF